MKLVEIGSEREQLSLCKLSLLLGVYTQENRIADFLKFACDMLQIGKGVFVFKEEPYGWHYFNECCCAFVAKVHDELENFFAGSLWIDKHHPNYSVTSKYLYDLDVQHSRFIAIALKDKHTTIGHVVLFDDYTHDYDENKLFVVWRFLKDLIGILNLRMEYSELKEVYEQQSALNSSKTKFFQIIAHDLRAPFHGLLGFSEVLAKERHVLDQNSIQDIADYLFDTAQSTYNLLESLLNWAMAEGGRFVCHPINFDIFQSSQIVTDVLSGMAINKNIKLVNNIPKNTHVYADINMITSVLQNLVSNALKFTPVDSFGEVILRAEMTEEQVQVYIHDTGLGMSKAQIETLFEPKLTVSVKGTGGEKGAGLGLVLCKRFIDLNNGSISVTSRKGEGTIFKVCLPKAKDVHKALVG